MDLLGGNPQDIGLCKLFDPLDKVASGGEFDAGVLSKLGDRLHVETKEL